MEVYSPDIEENPPNLVIEPSPIVEHEDTPPPKEYIVDYELSKPPDIKYDA